MNFTSTWKIADPLAQYIIYLRKSRKDMEAELSARPTRSNGTGRRLCRCPKAAG